MDSNGLCETLQCGMQVHKAALRDAGATNEQGLQLAVKVQYPKALEIMLQVRPASCVTIYGAKFNIIVYSS